MSTINGDRNLVNPADPECSPERPKQWVMPEWMEPYRDMIRNTGGNSVESLMNDHKTNGFNNSIRAALIVAVDSQVSLLGALHRAGRLS